MTSVSGVSQIIRICTPRGMFLRNVGRTNELSATTQKTTAVRTSNLTFYVSTVVLHNVQVFLVCIATLDKRDYYFVLENTLVHSHFFCSIYIDNLRTTEHNTIYQSHFPKSIIDLTHLSSLHARLFFFLVANRNYSPIAL